MMAEKNEFIIITVVVCLLEPALRILNSLGHREFILFYYLVSNNNGCRDVKPLMFSRQVLGSVVSEAYLTVCYTLHEVRCM